MHTWGKGGTVSGIISNVHNTGHDIFVNKNKMLMTSANRKGQVLTLILKYIL